MNEIIVGLKNILVGIPVIALASVGAGLLRNLAGWLENSLKDGNVSDYEWKELVGTVIKYFAGILLFTIGGIPLGGAVVATFVADLGVSAIKKAGQN